MYLVVMLFDVESVQNNNDYDNMKIDCLFVRKKNGIYGRG